MPRQVRVAEERYLRSPEAQLERLAGKMAGAWPCPLQREIDIRGGLAQRTAATAAAAAAKVAAAAAAAKVAAAAAAVTANPKAGALFSARSDISLSDISPRSDTFFAIGGRNPPVLLNLPPPAVTRGKLEVCNSLCNKHHAIEACTGQCNV